MYQYFCEMVKRKVLSCILLCWLVQSLNCTSPLSDEEFVKFEMSDELTKIPCGLFFSHHNMQIKIFSHVVD